MKYLIISLFFLNVQSFAQKLTYAKSETSYVASPTKEIVELMNSKEKMFLRNRDYCSEIENFLIENIQSLRIDSINTIYREGLKKNLGKIQKLKTEGNYGDYYLLLEDIVDDIEKNNLFYKDEDEYENKFLNEKIKKLEQQNTELKKELEYQKSLKVESKIK